MSKATNKFSPEVRQRAVRLVLDHEHENPSRWAAIMSISAKIGCTGQTLNEWVKKAEVDAGKRAGLPADHGMEAVDEVTGGDPGGHAGLDRSDHLRLGFAQVIPRRGHQLGDRPGAGNLV